MTIELPITLYEGLMKHAQKKPHMIGRPIVHVVRVAWHCVAAAPALLGRPLEFAAAAGTPARHDFHFEVEAAHEPRLSAVVLTIEGPAKAATVAPSAAHPGTETVFPQHNSVSQFGPNLAVCGSNCEATVKSKYITSGGSYIPKCDTMLSARGNTL